MAPIGPQLEAAGEPRPSLEVRLSRELVSLLSEQLYTSPLKAIEELVVNAFDADADTCRILLPPRLVDGPGEPIFVYDNGAGMDEDGLRDLWHIGHSSKRDAAVQEQRKRKQIGKFGIGKLATYAIARHITYLTKTASGPILSATLDYDKFNSDPTGAGPEVELPVVELSPAQVAAEKDLTKYFEALEVSLNQLTTADAHWTIVILEDLKPKVQELARGRLRWVLSTAMPLRADFRLYLDGEEISSSKEAYDELVSFDVVDLPQSRIESLNNATDEPWTRSEDALISSMFPSGVTGRVIVTKRTLTEGKSADLRRSHGFFVRVRGRLVNIEDPLFGLNPLSHQTFNRFRADLDADDLDQALTAPREGVESTSTMREAFEALLVELFYEARQRYEAVQRQRSEDDLKQREDQRNYVSIELVERPVADAISELLRDQEEVSADHLQGADADDAWFYLALAPGTRVAELLDGLYRDERSTTYTYTRQQAGETGRMVQFDPLQSLFALNIDHPVVRGHDDDGAARPLLEDFVTAEVLLEIYLREQRLPPRQIGEILERRDTLMRSLTQDRAYSFANIAADLRHASDNERDLEAALVTACRSLGFVAKHISGSDEPDGIARLTDNRAGEHLMTLEAKSSAKVPSLGAIDFATLARHVEDYKAHACLLVAPAYPGTTKGDDAAAARMAETTRISCWTVDQLATVVEAASRRHISARAVFQIAESRFSPDAVTTAVAALLAGPSWDAQDLYRAILDALRELEDRLPGTPRQLAHVHGELSREAKFRETNEEEVRRAASDLAGASRGSLVLLANDQLVLNTSIDELEVRVRSLVGVAGAPRRPSTFRRAPS